MLSQSIDLAFCVVAYRGVPRGTEHRDDTNRTCVGSERMIENSQRELIHRGIVLGCKNIFTFDQLDAIKPRE